MLSTACYEAAGLNNMVCTTTFYIIIIYSDIKGVFINYMLGGRGVVNFVDWLVKTFDAPTMGMHKLFFTLQLPA